MEDIFIFLKEIENELKYIEEVEDNLIRNLSLLIQEIRYIFSKIKSCDNYDLADWYFNILQKIQFSLSNLKCKESIDIKVPDALWWFTRDFERIDDKSLRESIFNKIKSSEYDFGKKLHGDENGN